MKNVFRQARILSAALCLGGFPALPQGQAPIEALRERLDRLERQNEELRQEIHALRRQLEQQTPAPAPAPPGDLEERLNLQAGRLAEHDQIKVESSQRVPIRLTGMALFNLFRNSRHSGGRDNPRTASPVAGRIHAGGTLRQSVVGLEFDGPEAVLGGRFRGSFLLDLFSGEPDDPLRHQVRLRTASIEGQWRTRGFMVGQEKPILAPREPNSLAQVGLSPLTAAGNLWAWRPQVRLEQRFGLGLGTELRARLGVSQTDEQYAQEGPEYLAPSLDPSRPALEGHFQLTRRFDDQRRLEIAPGFHWSATHVAGVSLPARAFSLDWFVNPHPKIEFTGVLFLGRNLAKLGGGGVRQGFTAVNLGGGEYRFIPVRTRGGWAQVTFLPAPRLSLNLYGGQDDPHNRDLARGGIAKNLSYAANVFYRLAHNVVVGAEVSQVRTSFLRGPRPLNNHYDLAVAYLF